MNNVKLVQHTFVSILYKNTARAVEEEMTFLTFIREREWPVKMATLRENMARCTELDKDLEKNQGNSGNVLSCLLDAHRRHFPDKVYELLGSRPPCKFIYSRNWSLEMNVYKRNCGFSKERRQNLSGLDCLRVGIIHKLDLDEVFETMRDKHNA